MEWNGGWRRTAREWLAASRKMQPNSRFVAAGGSVGGHRDPEQRGGVPQRGFLAERRGRLPDRQFRRRRRVISRRRRGGDRGIRSPSFTGEIALAQERSGRRLRRRIGGRSRGIRIVAGPMIACGLWRRGVVPLSDFTGSRGTLVGSAEGPALFSWPLPAGGLARRGLSERERVQAADNVSYAPSPTRGDCKASGEFSTPVPQSGRPLLATVPH